ncbi:hypothetical protein RSOL_031470, partial [Rhizoctonia solani AG-3 Rhs1AP]
MEQQIEDYANYHLEEESISLHPEAGHRPTRDRCLIRALNWFIFVKDDQFIAPVYADCTEEFWVGVKVYGFAASLSGKARWHIMGGFWSYAWGDKEFALVRIQGVAGLSKETNEHWRGGVDPTLWLETKAGYSYALLDPATEYSAIWKVVCHSWTPTGDGVDPTYRDVDPAFPRPIWWGGSRSWDYVQRMVEQEKKSAEECSEEESSFNKRGNGRTPREKASSAKSRKRKSMAEAASTSKPVNREASAGMLPAAHTTTPTKLGESSIPRSSDNKRAHIPSQRLSCPASLFTNTTAPRKKPRYVDINGNTVQDTPSRAGDAISNVSDDMLGPIMDYARSVGTLIPDTRKPAMTPELPAALNAGGAKRSFPHIGSAQPAPENPGVSLELNPVGAPVTSSLGYAGQSLHQLEHRSSNRYNSLDM